MKVVGTLSSVAFFVAAALASETASYDTGYDDAGASTLGVSCSDGSNGLASRFPTYGAFPTFPNIGGASAVGGWNSPNCGTCWQLTYEGTGNSIIFTAIDVSLDGFNLSEESMNTLTNGQAVELGRVQVDVQQVDKSLCGL